MAVSELEAAVAALPGKRDALREAYDRLAACSPSPLSFAWEDLDAHLSSLQASISLRFRQFQVLEAAHTAPADVAFGRTRRDRTTGVLEEEDEEEAEEEEMQEGVYDEADDKIGNDGKNDEEVVDEVGEVNEDTNMDQMVAKKASAMLGNEEEGASMEEEQGTSMDEMAAKKASPVHCRAEEDASMEEEPDTNMDEMMAKKVSAVQGKEAAACSEKQEEEAEDHGAHEVEEDAKNSTKGEAVVAKEVSRDQGNQALPDRFNDRTSACTSMDAQRSLKLICTSIMLNSEDRDAFCHAPDAAALALQIVELFLHSKILKTRKFWANCVRIIQMVPVAVTKPSADTIEQAKRVARDWNKMIVNPGSCMVLGNLASWGLLYFLISYNIVSEFDTKEIFHLFGTIPRKNWKNSAFLIKAIGLTDRIPVQGLLVNIFIFSTELMDYLIKNGQQRYVLYLARGLNLVDKCSPLSLLKGYIERAEQTARKICEKTMTLQSLRAVIIKEIDNLERALDIAKQEITDSSLYTSISAEIFVLLDEFVEKERSLANASTASTSNSQQQQIENNKKRKVQEQKKIENNKKHKKVRQQKHHKGQENQQQGQASKLREELAKKRNKPQQEQQQKQDKPKEKQQQKQDKPNEKQQNKQKCTKRKQASSAVRGMAPGGHFGYTPYTRMHHHGYPAQPVWPVNHFAALFVPQLGAPGYVGPVNPFYSCPEFCPW
ncbi:hypothetical protein U9M48_009861 [Paspalum notatum var. saurae]|uniref:FRIGIDA-like protein n=1 Tax=Paspalum notatum var. saurae TaxID=547442 RepID=A0AAQ3SS38_PASNO